MASGDATSSRSHPCAAVPSTRPRVWRAPRKKSGLFWPSKQFDKSFSFTNTEGLLETNSVLFGTNTAEIFNVDICFKSSLLPKAFSLAL